MKTIRRVIRRIYINFKRQYISMFCLNIKCGSNLNFRRGFLLNCSKTGIICIGDNVFFNNDCSLNCKGKIEIGNECIFGENVKIYDHNHRFNDFNKPISEQGFNIGNIKIGNNCWIASGAILLSGTKIGDNVVIGAGCIISSEIPDGFIVTANRKLCLTQRIHNAN